MGWSEDEDDRRYLVVVNYGFRAVSWGESLVARWCSCWHAWGLEEGSGGEIVGVDESVGDAFEHAEFVVGAFDTAVADTVTGVESEDLVSPGEQRFGEPVELGERVLLVGGDERAECLVGFLVGIFSGVDAVEVSGASATPLRVRGRSVRTSPRASGPVVVEVVVAGQLEIPRAEDGRFERRPGAVLADALDAATDFDHPRSEPAGDVEPVQHVPGMSEMLMDRFAIRRRAVRHHHLDASHPPMPLGLEEPGQGLGVAVLDDT